MKRVLLAAVVAVAALAFALPVAWAQVAQPVVHTDVTRVTYPAVVTLTTTATAENTHATFKWRRNDQEAGGWVELGSVPVSPNDPGLHTFIVRPKYNASYTVSFDGVDSEPVYVPVYVPMGTPAISSLVRPNTTANVTGTIRPLHPAGAIELQWKKWDPRTRRWVAQPSTVAASAVNLNIDTTKWSYDLRITRSMIGLWSVRSGHACPRHTQSYSAWKKFTVL